MRIEIVGRASSEATNDLLAIEGVDGSVENTGTKYREGVFVTVATIVAITSGTLTIADKIYAWYQKWKSDKEKNNESINRVVLIASNDSRILLGSASIEEVKELFDSEFKE